MPTLDPRVDAYIARAPDFARPLLVRLREIVHRGCPDVVETIKWGFPNFEHHGLLCSMAAFKQHCSFGFWKGTLVAPGKKGERAMGQFGRLRSLADLPAERTLAAWVRKAAALNEQGVKVQRPAKRPKPRIPVPAELSAALALERHARARATFDALSPSGQREYLEWITGAKGEATRARRLATTLEWLNEGKARNWKYAK